MPDIINEGDKNARGEKVDERDAGVLTRTEQLKTVPDIVNMGGANESTAPEVIIPGTSREEGNNRKVMPST